MSFGSKIRIMEYLLLSPLLLNLTSRRIINAHVPSKTHILLGLFPVVFTLVSVVVFNPALLKPYWSV